METELTANSSDGPKIRKKAIPSQMVHSRNSMAKRTRSTELGNTSKIFL